MQQVRLGALFLSAGRSCKEDLRFRGDATVFVIGQVKRASAEAARAMLSMGGVPDFRFVDLDAEAVAGGDCECSVLEREWGLEEGSG